MALQLSKCIASAAPGMPELRIASSPKLSSAEQRAGLLQSSARRHISSAAVNNWPERVYGTVLFVITLPKKHDETSYCSPVYDYPT